MPTLMIHSRCCLFIEGKTTTWVFAVPTSAFPSCRSYHARERLGYDFPSRSILLEHLCLGFGVDAMDKTLGSGRPSYFEIYST